MRAGSRIVQVAWAACELRPLCLFHSPVDTIPTSDMKLSEDLAVGSADSALLQLTPGTAWGTVMAVRRIRMSIVTMDEQMLKTLLKAAIVEVLEERRDFVRDIIEEALEDAGLVGAIDEGLHTGPVSRADIFSMLDAA